MPVRPLLRSSAMDLRDLSDVIKARNAGLAGSSFEDADLSRARFQDVNLSGAVFQDVNMTNVSIDDANLTGMTIRGVKVTDLIDAYEQSKGKDDV